MLVNVGSVQAALRTDHAKSVPVVEVDGLGKLVDLAMEGEVGSLFVSGPWRRWASEIERAGE